MAAEGTGAGAGFGALLFILMCVYMIIPASASSMPATFFTLNAVSNTTKLRRRGGWA